MPAFEDYAREIRSLWDSRMLTNGGEKHAALTAALKEKLGVKELALCVNGHQALEGVLDTLQLTGEVITTPFTFISTTAALVRRGLTPVFCDIDPADYTLDETKLEALITPRTSAILGVHVYGRMCHAQAIDRIAEKHGLKVIYDAAHAFGVTKNGVSAAAFGSASVFSFHATKVFHTAEGGAAVFREEADRIRFERWKNCGLEGENPAFPGCNAKMSELSAAMGLCNLRRLEESIAGRKAAAEAYDALLKGVRGVRLPPVQPGVTLNYAYYPVVLEPSVFGTDVAGLLQKLNENGIGARRYFHPLTSLSPMFGGKYSASDTPVAARVSENVLCLPLYEELSAADVRRICAVITGGG